MYLKEKMQMETKIDKKSIETKNTTITSVESRINGENKKVVIQIEKEKNNRAVFAIGNSEINVILPLSAVFEIIKEWKNL